MSHLQWIARTLGEVIFKAGRMTFAGKPASYVVLSGDVDRELLKRLGAVVRSNGIFLRAISVEA